MLVSCVVAALAWSSNLFWILAVVSLFAACHAELVSPFSLEQNMFWSSLLFHFPSCQALFDIVFFLGQTLKQTPVHTWSRTRWKILNTYFTHANRRATLTGGCARLSLKSCVMMLWYHSFLRFVCRFYVSRVPTFEMCRRFHFCRLALVSRVHTVLN